MSVYVEKGLDYVLHRPVQAQIYVKYTHCVV